MVVQHCPGGNYTKQIQTQLSSHCICCISNYSTKLLQYMRVYRHTLNKLLMVVTKIQRGRDTTDNTYNCSVDEANVENKMYRGHLHIKIKFNR